MRGILFDFDGVIADSETLANTVLAEAVTALGLPTSPGQAIDRYMGKRWTDIMALISQQTGNPLAANFPAEVMQATLERFRRDLREVAGVRDFLHQFAHLPRAIASSSPLPRITLCLEVLGLQQEFAGAVFSADLVPRGKPHPDIYLYAAERIGVAPSHCLVLEDSASGTRAGVAAGMTVIGLCAGSHCRPDHAQKLTAAGAQWTAASYQEALTIASSLLSTADVSLEGTT